MTRPARTVLARTVLAALGLMSLTCGSNSPAAPDGGDDCSVLGQVQFVRSVLREYYLWYRELPDPAPSGFRTPEDYLEAVRYRTLDTSFSYITLRETSQAFFSESQFIGFGFRTSLVGTDDFRAIDVFAGSPATEAGLDRGSRFLEINGRTIADLVATNQLGSIFGASEVGVTARVRFLDRAGQEHSATMVKRTVTIPTVAVEQTYRVGGRNVGYVLFENFVTPSTNALSAAFARLAAAGVNDLVLDMRYNGGGLVSVGQHLGGLIGGRTTAGQPFVRFVHNDRQSQRDNTLTFPEPAGALGLSRLIVVATQSSASASELVINSLRPFMPVTVVGDRTYGKPVGQYGFDFCDKTIFPVAFSTRNARNEGDYFNGIPADCPAPDDFSHALGDASEGSLSEALNFLRTGRCSGTAAASARAQSLRRPPEERQPHRQDGWQVTLGAY